MENMIFFRPFDLMELVQLEETLNLCRKHVLPTYRRLMLAFGWDVPFRASWPGCNVTASHTLSHDYRHCVEMEIPYDKLDWAFRLGVEHWVLDVRIADVRLSFSVSVGELMQWLPRNSRSIDEPGYRFLLDIVDGVLYAPSERGGWRLPAKREYSLAKHIVRLDDVERKRRQAVVYGILAGWALHRQSRLSLPMPCGFA